MTIHTYKQNNISNKIKDFPCQSATVHPKNKKGFQEVNIILVSKLLTEVVQAASGNMLNDFTLLFLSELPVISNWY